LQNPALGAAYASITQTDENADAHYDALLLSIQHRFSHGFTWLTNYTWSHCLSDADFTGEMTSAQYENPHNRSADYGNCNFDVRSNSNTSLIMLSPVKGKGLSGRLFRQWQIAPILSIHTGAPVNVYTGSDIAQTGIGLDRPNLVLPDAYLHGPNPLAVLNPVAFKPAVPGTFGDLGRNALWGPGLLECDMSLSRQFHVRERWELEARFEAFNVINHPNFVGAVTTSTAVNPTSALPPGAFSNVLTASTFGTIQSANDPRILQFSLKLHF
jgi:hypothetical protein